MANSKHVSRGTLSREPHSVEPVARVVEQEGAILAVAPSGSHVVRARRRVWRPVEEGDVLALVGLPDVLEALVVDVERVVAVFPRVF